MPTNEPRPLSIVHYLREVRLEAGGVVRAVLDLCRVLGTSGHRVTLLTLDDADAPAEWREPTAGMPRVVRLRGNAAVIPRLTRQKLGELRPYFEEADVVHLHTPWELSNLPLARVLRRTGKPYAVTIHGMLDDWSMAQKGAKKRLFLLLAGRRFLEGASAVHLTAEMERQQALKWMPGAKGRAYVVPLVFDVEPFERLPSRDEAHEIVSPLGVVPPYVLFLSRVHPKKGIELLFEAMRQSFEQGKPWRLVIAGPGERSYVSRLQVLARELGLTENVLFVGMMEGLKKIALYRGAELFALPTFQENFGFVLVEAMACGAPVVTTRGTDIWAELARGGAVIADRTAAAFSEAIEQLRGDAAERASRGEEGRRFVLEWLRAERVIGDYEAMYRAATAVNDAGEL